MRKIDGLKFLQKNFPDLTVDCLVVDKVENLDEQELEKSNLWRVRGGRTIGSELNLPQGTFSDKKELKQFMKEQKQKDRNMEFVIHSVSPKYFAAPFVGTLAVYNNHQNPGMRIELQKVTRELVENIDKKGGKRPRDWEACLILDYEFRNKFPKIKKSGCTSPGLFYSHKYQRITIDRKSITTQHLLPLHTRILLKSTDAAYSLSRKKTRHNTCSPEYCSQ